MATYTWDPVTGTYVLSGDLPLSVATDQSDYSPGETVQITANFDPGSTVEFTVAHDIGAGADGIWGTADDVLSYDLTGTGLTWTATADANGLINASWLVNNDALNQSFELIAVEQAADGTFTGPMVTTFFTDGVQVPSNIDSANDVANLTGSGTNPVNSATLTGNGGIILAKIDTSGTGTGAFEAFLRIQGGAQDTDHNAGTEEGFNTNADPLPLDDVSSDTHTHAIQLQNIALVDATGATTTDTPNGYREFILDIAQTGANPFLSLDDLKIFDGGSNSTIGGTLSDLSSDAAQLYNINLGAGQFIALEDLNSGNGQDDYRVLIPNSYFAGKSDQDFIYLYSKFGYQGDGWSANSSFEEWGVTGGTTGGGGPTPHAALSLTKDTVCPDDGARVSNGTLLAGNAVDWTYTVQDVGDDNTFVQNLTLTDDQLGTLYSNGHLASNVTLSGDTNHDGILEKGETWVFTATGTTIDTSQLTNGVYTNLGTITGDGFSGDPQNSPTETDPGLSAFDTSSYKGVTVDNTSIAVDKLVSIDGGKTYVDSDSATGPILLSGFAKPMFEYTLTNNGPLAISAQTLTDDNGTPGNPNDDFSTTQANGAGSMIVQVMGQDNTAGEGDSTHNIGDLNDNGLIDPGETWTFTATGVWATGQYTNTATTSATFTDDCDNTAIATGTASANYFGAAPSITIEKDILCPDGTFGPFTADDPLHPVKLLKGDGTVTYQIVVTNNGNVALAAPIVSDPTLAAALAAATPVQSGGSGGVGSNSNNILDIGESWTYTITGTWAAGLHTNTATATDSFTDSAGNVVDSTNDASLDVTDSASYFGLDPEITLDKKTNGVDHGLKVLQGQAITWTYDVTNSGNADLTGVSVTDNPSQTISQVLVTFNGNQYNSGDTNHDGILNVGETWHFSASGTAGSTAYTNIATASANITDDCGDSATPAASDTSDYTPIGQTLAGLTKGYWSTHLTLWDVTTGDEKGAGAELNVVPKYDWDHDTHTGSTDLSTVTTSGSSSSLGQVKGNYNGGGDSGLLMGDLNHDGMVTGDGSSDHLFFDLASAQILANSSVSGDARIILASQAVAAQLNEYNDYVYDQAHGGLAAGFDASPTGLIEEAVKWMEGLGPLSNGDSKINWSTANDLTSPAVQAIIDTSVNTSSTNPAVNTNDYTISGSAITFKSASMSSSDASWTHFGTVLTGYTPGTDINGNAINNPGNFNTVQADGEGLKNALAAYNHGGTGTGGFVISTDGSLIGWQDTAGGTVYDVHANTQDAFWGILEDQNLLGQPIVGVTGVHV